MLPWPFINECVCVRETDPFGSFIYHESLGETPMFPVFWTDHHDTSRTCFMGPPLFYCLHHVSEGLPFVLTENFSPPLSNVARGCVTRS